MSDKSSDLSHEYANDIRKDESNKIAYSGSWESASVLACSFVYMGATKDPSPPNFGGKSAMALRSSLRATPGGGCAVGCRQQEARVKWAGSG